MFKTEDQRPCPGGMVPSEIGYLEDWHHVFSTRFVGTLFIAVFILNGIFVMFEERKAWKDVYNTFRYLDIITEKFKLTGVHYLVAGAVVNCWVVFWCCLDMYMVVGASTSPQDLLMDSLGLIFLFNLDDIGGDMAFIDEDDWPALRIAWIYEEMVHPCPDDIFDEDDSSKFTWPGWFCIKLYQLETYSMMILLVLAPLMAIATPFTQIAPAD